MTVYFLVSLLLEFKDYNSYKILQRDLLHDKGTWINNSSLRNVHWLPIKSRIQFNVVLLIYQWLHHLAPFDLTKLLTPYKSDRMLRSSSKSLLCVPQTVTKSCRERSFSYAEAFLGTSCLNWKSMGSYKTWIIIVWRHNSSPLHK